jgi:hypothetical protein
MILTQLGGYLEVILEGWLALIFAIVLYRMARGQIILTGLLRIEAKAPFGFDRLQLVGVTLLFAIGYAIFALNIDQLETLPEIPTPLLLVLIGSNGTYLAVKYTKCSAYFGAGGRGR